jgi:hypothetical protein
MPLKFTEMTAQNKAKYNTQITGNYTACEKRN